MNASDVLESLSIETITQILAELGAEPVKETNEYIIFTSICHGSDSHKLYLYKSSKTFHCYSHCGNMSLFDVVMKIKQCEFKDAFKYVKTFASGGGIHGFYKPYQKTSLEDVVVEPLPLINKPFLYKMYKSCEIKEWLEDNIDYNATKKFNIRKDFSDDPLFGYLKGVVETDIFNRPGDEVPGEEETCHDGCGCSGHGCGHGCGHTHVNGSHDGNCGCKECGGHDSCDCDDCSNGDD